MKKTRINQLMLMVTCILLITCPVAAYILLSIDVTDSQDPVMAFTPYTYNIDYTFNSMGGEPAMIIDQLPSEVSFDSATGGGIYESATHSVHWDVPQTWGSSVSVTVIPDNIPVPTCIVQEPPSVEIQNTATISVSTQSETDTESTTILVPIPVCGPEFPRVAVPAVICLVTCVLVCIIRKYHW